MQRSLQASEQSVQEFVSQNALRCPDTVAVEFEGRHVTYAGLNSAANRLAHALIARGIRSREVIGLSVTRSIESIIALYGILKAGCAVAPMDPNYPEDRIALMARTAKLPFLITDSSQRHRFSHLKGTTSLLPIEELTEESSRFGSTDPKIERSREDLLYIIFTSGSTGQPKGVAMPHGPLVNLVEWQAGVSASLPRPARTLQFTTLSFDVAFQEIFSTARDGGTLVLMREELRYDPLRLLRYLREQGIHRLFLPFVALNQLAEVITSQTEDELPHELQQVITAGEALHATAGIRAMFTRLPSARLHNHYGPSETHVATALALAPDPNSWAALPSIGSPIAQTQIHLLDDQGKPVPPNEPGEIYISGACLAQGYLYRDDLTQERFPRISVVCDGERGSTTRCYRTGDLARRNADGSLEFLGRKDHQVKIRGHRIELGEIETVLGGHPSVKECAVSTDGNGVDRRLVAYVIWKSPEEAIISDLRTFLRTRLPEYAIPSAYVSLTALPLTPSGKLDRRALPRPVQDLPPSSERIAPSPTDRNETQPGTAGSMDAEIAAIWKEILGVSTIDADANFFDLGGHSLLLVKVQRALEERLQRSISILDLFRFPTLRSLSAHLEAITSSNQTATNPSSTGSNAERGGHGISNREPIALIGIAGRWPGANNPKDLWQLLMQGKDAVTDLTDDALQSSGARAEIMADPGFVKRRGILHGVDLFDAEFFGFTPKDAAVTDPQQRLMLECAWEAFEDAGIDPSRQKDSVGVFAGTSLNTYFLRHVLPTRTRVESFTLGFQVENYPVLVGSDKDYIATRIAYKLNLRGPAITVQTACSTSLVAVTQACAALWSGQCEVAIAGGASITFPQERGYLYQEGAIASQDGRCRAFDIHATGTVFSAGVGCVVLKPLSKALEDGDRIYAVIRGAAVNNDGAQKVSFSAPSIEGQSRVIRTALSQAGVPPSSIGYVEAHGTGTPLGDPIEVAALKEALDSGDPGQAPCILGSVKPNLGHLESAAGVTGLIKAALALHHGSIPGTPYFTAPNPKCGLEGSRFSVSSTPIPWPRNNSPRRAGVSSFGVGGTNAHVVLEEAPLLKKPSLHPTEQLLILSARSEAALETQTQQTIQRLNDASQIPNGADAINDLARMAVTLQKGRQGFRHRRIVVARSSEDAAGHLKSKDPKLVFSGTADSHPPRVVFLFPGQGAQYPGMTEELYATESVFRESMNRCCDALLPSLNLDLRRILYPQASGTDPAHAAQQLRDTALAQPALFCVEFSLACLWKSWGVQPSILIGHSIGEYVAAVLAHVMSPETALSLVAKRGRLMQSLPPGGMLSVRLGREALRPYLNSEISIAAINSPSACVLSGPHPAIAAIADRLTQDGVACKPLHTSHAFHSPMMEPMCEEFEREIAQAGLQIPQLPLISSRTGDKMPPEAWCRPDYWSGQVRETVRFADALQTLNSNEGFLVLEVGPGQTLTALARQNLNRQSARAILPSMPPVGEPSERRALLLALGRLWIEGVEIDWNAVSRDRGVQKTSIPTYPFERKRHWMDAPISIASDTPSQGPDKAVGASGSDGSVSSLDGSTDAVERAIRQQLHVMRLQLEVLGHETETPFKKAG